MNESTGADSNDPQSADGENPTADSASSDASQTGPVSLESLTSAFEEMLRPAGDSIAFAEEAGGEPDDVDHRNPETSADEDSAGDVTPKSLLEAMLFVGHPDRSPVTTEEMAALIRDVDPAELDALVRELNAEYTANGCPYHIVATGAGYRLTLCDEFAGVRDKFYGRVREARLSQAAIEVLAIVAYKGPLAADDVNRMRGRPSGPILAQLVRRRLLEYRNGDHQRRRATYVTTGRFLEVFGLGSIDDLPRSHDLDHN